MYAIYLCYDIIYFMICLFSSACLALSKNTAQHCTHSKKWEGALTWSKAGLESCSDMSLLRTIQLCHQCLHKLRCTSLILWAFETGWLSKLLNPQSLQFMYEHAGLSGLITIDHCRRVFSFSLTWKPKPVKVAWNHQPLNSPCNNPGICPGVVRMEFGLWLGWSWGEVWGWGCGEGRG